MLDSKETLIKFAKELDYKPEILEKVYHLLSVLEQIMSVSYLRERLALKGGTALNLFSFDTVPRLSVDLDLNYIGHSDREKMLDDRQIISHAISQILQQNKYKLHISPEQHAGGKMVWRYNSVLGQRGNLELDLNYMYRQPLWPCTQQRSKIDFGRKFSVPILDIHELTAGKLSALLSRNTSRDFFDTYYLFTQAKLDAAKLRLAFVIYLSMTTIDVARLNEQQIQYDLFDIKNRLLPVLRQRRITRKSADLKDWADDMLDKIVEQIKVILPLQPKEQEFIERVRIDGAICPTLITKDSDLQRVILNHSAIKWSTLKARPGRKIIAKT